MTTILILLAAHWIADFVLQSRRDAEAKSHDIWALLRHVGTYSVFMTLVAIFIFPAKTALTFGLITFICHLITDFFTSKGSAYSYLKTKETFTLSADTLLEPGSVLSSSENFDIKVISKKYDGKYDVIWIKKYDFWTKIFWTIIGGDQLLHTIQILLTYQYIQNGINI